MEKPRYHSRFPGEMPAWSIEKRTKKLPDMSHAEFEQFQQEEVLNYRRAIKEHLESSEEEKNYIKSIDEKL
jgi:hypothetical protein